MKKYEDILKEIKEKNPEISQKNAQIAASKEHKALKRIAQANDATDAAKDEPKPKKALSFDPDNVENEIRKAGVNIHSIQKIGAQFDKNLKLVKAGKDGVNTKVYLDGPARVPRTGYFLIWI